MDTTLLWNDHVPPKDGIKNPINDVAFSPDGTRIIVGVGNRVLLYNAANGDLIKSGKGHKDKVVSVDYSFDGSRYASGGLDNTVIIWSDLGSGMMKYNHSAPILRIACNPTTVQFASCSEVDFGLWSPTEKQVTKEKVPSKILSVAWALNGSFLALGLESGTISIRNQRADEVYKIDKGNSVWCLAFLPDMPSSKGHTTESEILVVGCWDKTLSMYKFTEGSGPRIQSERSLKYYPCSISIAGSNSTKSSYLAIAGSNNKVTLYSRDGLRLAELVERQAWMWCCACHTASDRIVTGCDDGGIDVVKMSFSDVHALYMDRYAYRENLTEVVVQHLVSDRKVRIKCRDLVQKLSLYRNKLAVQLTDKTCIYESNAEDNFDMHFRLRRERIAMDIPCDHMVVTSNHLVYATEKQIQLYAFDGKRQRLWNVEAPVCFMRIDGGPSKREGLFVGLENGAILKLWTDNPIPVEMSKQSVAPIGIDASVYRKKLVIVDNTGKLTVIDTKSRQPIFTSEGVRSACFNSQVEDMLCYSEENAVYVVSGIDNMEHGGSSSTSEPEGQNITGLASGFHGQKIYCLDEGKVTGLDVPQGQNIKSALEGGDVEAAYDVACLGATDEEWRILATSALRANHLTVARNAYARLKDTEFLSLIDAIERSDSGNNSPARKTSSVGLSRNERRASASAITASLTEAKPLAAAWQAESLAYEGHHIEAAKLYSRNGLVDEAIRILADLRLYEEAKAISTTAGKKDVSNLNILQARWLQQTCDWSGASKIFLSMGLYMDAARVLTEGKSEGWVQALMDVVHICQKEQKDVLSYCGDAFTEENLDDEARETYMKLGDLSKLMTLYIRKERWADAAKLADEHEGEFDCSMFLPYAEWLVAQDEYEDAMQAYRKAGRGDLARKVLEELTHNAVLESRFKDAAYYYWLLSREADHTKEDQLIQIEYEHKADLYFAYSSIHAFVTDPFTSQQPEMLFQVARFIINSLGSSINIPHGISKASTLYTLARQSMVLGAFKLARHTYDRLSKLQLSTQRQQDIEHDMLIVQAKPVRDDPNHLPVCYRCGSTNPLLNPFTNKFAKGDVCTNCGHPFVRSFISFDILPLVEFVPNPNISDEEAIDLIRQSPNGSGGSRNSSDSWNESKTGNADTMTFDGPSFVDDDINAPGGVDLFTRHLNAALESQGNATSYIPVTVDANGLMSIKRSEVFVCRPSTSGKRATFYKNMLPDISIAISQPCHRFFHLEDFEFEYLSEKRCPYSRLKNVGEYGSL